jgi:3-oxoacyl-[acyl-carrier-protein] synthase II
MVLGEGAGAVILEEVAHAQARGAKIYGEVIGTASGSVISHNGVARRQAALTNVMISALRDADSRPEDIGHLHAHGLSTRSCDEEEAAAIGAVFGECAAKLPVTAAKSYFGNLGAGSGLVEMIASVLALAHGRLFKVLNHETPDPLCPLAITRGDSRAGKSFLNVNVTPQGQASAVVVRAFD